MNIDIGMPNLIETKTLNECVMLCRDLDLQFIELNMNLPNIRQTVLMLSALLSSSD